ncbi:MAG TPA: ATP-dependent DNA helicase RecG [Phycisphaerales bacterium]|nr:ATP-dependent DNA helicase RecG [Phycisphaerales bacterium]
MPDKPPITLTTNLLDAGLATERQAALLGALGIATVGRLIAHLPMRHETLESETTVADLLEGSIGSVRGEVTAVRMVRGRSSRLEAVIMDHTGRLDVTWFNGTYLAERVRPGVRLRVQGKVQRRGPQTQMINPKLEVLNPIKDEPQVRDARIRPVYPASEAINSAEIEKVIAKVLPRALPLLEEHFTPEYRKERDLPTLADAYRMMHQPFAMEEIGRARRRLAFDELLLLQLGVAMKRAQLRDATRSPALTWNATIDQRIRARVPYTLTSGQEQVIADLIGDLTTSTPTNRLIQGDVGAGKTIVALYAMMLAVASGHQASLMAPTEILAEQHFAGISKLLAGSKVRVEMLTGSVSTKDRASILARLAEGEIDLLIGTHALLTETVAFKSLAVAIIDEQHRFGVSQRATLRAQGSDVGITPHVIVMTATPIPRSLALTLFGDLDISTITGLPPGRKPVKTKVISSHQRTIAYDDLRARIEQGEQGFVVVPAIEPGEIPANGTTPLIDVRTVQRAMEDQYLHGRHIAALHGDLKRATRDAVMERFRLGQIDAVVATTVIEVGVDIPNATVMIVEQADRFGLAQLHQLRGRVGRGDKPAVCYLIGDPNTPEGNERLAVMERTNDGFVLAEKDLEIRGMGEVFGLKQSGLPPFRVAEPMRDRDLLLLARHDAKAWIDKTPKLDAPQDALLRRRLMKAHGKYFGLGDVG